MSFNVLNVRKTLEKYLIYSIGNVNVKRTKRKWMEYVWIATNIWTNVFKNVPRTLKKMKNLRSVKM